MKQENKILLLQDLCARLPYGVKCQIKGEEDFEPLKLKSFIQGKGFYAFDFYIKENSSLTFKELDEFKPYLFPLSSMTSKQKAELSILVLGVEDIFKALLIEVEFYHKHHVDYRGLIPMGLANDATNLNIY